MKKLPQSEKRELEVLRQLLVGSEIAQLDQLSKRLENHETFSSDVGDVLPQALVKSAGQGEQLSQALVPTVEEIVRLSVKRDIDKFADALFPVIGPAIRKSIGETIRQMLQSVNQVIDNSLSWQGIKWRLESIRTGISFSQIVLANSLIYEVDQVFLIHQTSGLMIGHMEREGRENRSPDLVSSMLAAIGDFVSDSFESEERQKLDSIEVGEMSIWIERSPTVILALAIHGSAPESLRSSTMQETLEQVESLYSDALINFNGDVTVFDNINSVLFKCLQAHYRSTRKKVTAKFWLSCLIITSLLLYWMSTSIYQSMLQDDYLAILESEPGYAVTRVENDAGVIKFIGLRDPLSRLPEDMIALSKLDAEMVEHQFEPYRSLEHSLVLKRLINIILPPDNVKLSIDKGVLVISGYSSEDWVSRIDQNLMLATGIFGINKDSLNHHIDLVSLSLPATVSVELDINRGHLLVTGAATRTWRNQASIDVQKIPGIRSYDDSELIEIVDVAVFDAPDTIQFDIGASSLKASGLASYRWLVMLKEKVKEFPQILEFDYKGVQVKEQIQLQADIESLKTKRVFFDAATSFNFEANPVLDDAVVLIKRIIINADILQKTPKIIVQGYSDSIGSFEDNLFLSRERADYVSQYLFNTGISPKYIVNQGLEVQVEPEKTDEERRFNRRVDLVAEIN